MFLGVTLNMLFVLSKSLNGKFDDATRLAVLEHLAERGFQPLIRSMRREAFDFLMRDEARARELEQLIVRHREDRGALYAAYTRGDIFCFDDYALFLIFDDEEDEREACVRVGIIYEKETIEPQHKLDEFGRHVQVALIAAKSEEASAFESNGAAEHGSLIHTIGLATWKPSTRWRRLAEARLKDFKSDENAPAARGDSSMHGAQQNELTNERAKDLLRDEAARRLLQRLVEAQADGRVVKRAANAADDPRAENLIAELTNAGLVQREVLVSCRKEGRGLFRLRDLDALNALTASGARCHECGRPIADERAEEIITPTSVAAQMLAENSCLEIHLRDALTELGLTEANVLAQSNADGNRYWLVNVCGELFLLLMREGVWTTMDSAKTLELVSQMRAAHVVVMATGRAHAEARVLLQEAMRRRARSQGEHAEAVFCDDVNSIAARLEPAFARAARQAVCDELCELDASLGFSVGFMVATRFQMRHRPPSPLEDFVLSAAQEISTNLGAL
jgi:hypothetical protein